MSDRLKTKRLLEALNEGQVVGPVLLIEDADFFVTSINLVEGIQEGKNQQFLEVEGRFQHADLKNHNGRVYPKTLWERVLRDESITGQLKNGGMHGHLDHPEDGKTLVEKVSHIITNLRLDEKTGEVIGRARVLNNQWGNQLKSIFEAGGTVGISSRGSGSVKMVNGVNVVQEDFRLNTFDFVNVPSTPNAFPKPVGEHTIARGRELRNENLEEDSMSASLKKLAEVRNEVSIILTAQPEKLNEGGRDKFMQDLDAAEYKINKLISEDTAVSSLAQPLLQEIADKRDDVKLLSENAFAMTAPMVMNTLPSQISERKCACGFPGCDCAAGVCECYNKMMGFTESYNDFEEASEFEDYDLDAFLAELEDDDEYESLDENEEISHSAIAQQYLVVQKVYEADRSASGQVIGALAARIKSLMAQQPVAEGDLSNVATYKGQIAELQAENYKLRKLLSGVQETITSAEAVQESFHFNKAAAIDQIIAEEPKAKLWVSRLLKANSLEELAAINMKAKAEILVETSSDPSLPSRGATKKFEVNTEKALNEGAALSHRIMQSMKSRGRNTLISRGGQILEAKSDVK